MADPQGIANELFDTWRRQFEEGTRAWASLVSQTPAPPPDPFSFWRPVLDQGLQNWARLFAQTPVSPDLLGQWKQFLDQWIEAWSKVLAQTMGTEAFAQMMGRSLDQWLVAEGPVKKASEQSRDAMLQTLNLASRSQLTSVAKQIVELEDRIERIEDGIGALLTRFDQLARTVSGPAPPADEGHREGGRG